MSDRSWIQFTDGTVWWAKPRPIICACIEGVQTCAFHGLQQRAVAAIWAMS